MSPSPSIHDKVVLITGGTGSFGSTLVKRLLADHEPAAVRVYSRDELKQYDLAEAIGHDPRVRMLLGDVRDPNRLSQAMRGVDVVVHAAALKQVPACEYNPFEAVQTNIIGAENVITAAIDAGVPKCLSISTDKAVNPVNLYGATKLCAEKVFAQGNAYGAALQNPPQFSSARYGNVVGSRGSVVPLFKRQAASGQLTITDESMTRFWITLDQAVDFVISCIDRMLGGETFIPRLPSASVTDLAQAIAPDADIEVIGIRPGEKLHETLITGEESRNGAIFDDFYAIYPAFPFSRPEGFPGGEPLAPGFSYSSDTNDEWLTVEEIRSMVLGLAPVD